MISKVCGFSACSNQNKSNVSFGKGFLYLHPSIYYPKGKITDIIPQAEELNILQKLLERIINGEFKRTKANLFQAEDGTNLVMAHLKNKKVALSLQNQRSEQCRGFFKDKTNSDIYTDLLNALTVMHTENDSTKIGLFGKKYILATIFSKEA